MPQAAQQTRRDNDVGQAEVTLHDPEFVETWMDIIDHLTTCSQFINDKFLYNHGLAMEMLVQCGLKEQLLELAKVLTDSVL